MTETQLSHRSKRLPHDVDYIYNYSVVPAVRNPFHEDNNPEGIINFGTAVNGLMDDVWLHRFRQNQISFPYHSQYQYYQFYGVDEFRMKIAKFMTRFFNPRQEIDFNNLFVLNGALVSLDILSYLLADEGDSFIYLAPGYNGYMNAGSQRWGVNMVPIPMNHNERTGELFELTVSSMEKAISDEESKGRKVRAFVFNNPHNPLGKVFRAEMVKEIMTLCQRHKIHLIADEMYCMSVFNKGQGNVETESESDNGFHSVLDIHDPEILDPNRLHVIWGFSKDLCLTSFRTGVVHTYNKELQMALKSQSQFQAVPLPVMHILGKVIEDIDWFANVFVPTNHARMQNNYDKCKKFFDTLGLRTTTTNAGFFFLADLRPLLNPPNKVNSKAFIKKLYKNKVYLTPSWDMEADDGWFRFVFTSVSENGLETGLKRLQAAIEEWKLEMHS